jgi:hypothetical protein
MPEIPGKVKPEFGHPPESQRAEDRARSFDTAALARVRLRMTDSWHAESARAGESLGLDRGIPESRANSLRA